MGDPSERLVEHLRWQAGACSAMGSPLYASLLARVADDVLAAGPAEALLESHGERPGPDAVGLRLAGGVHRLVLEGRAPDLARHYPSTGGDGDARAAWPAFRAVLADHAGELAEGLRRAPQTNEVGRAAALWPAVLLAASEHAGLPVHLVEVGASAGLLLRADRVRYRGGGVAWGPAGSPVVLDPAWAAAPPWWPAVPAHVDVASRTGADLSPVDPTTADGATGLLSYVWPDQIERLARLRGALRLAAEVPVRLVRCSAADLLDRLEPADGALTVVQHSVVRQYLDAGERSRVDARLEALGGSATPGRPFAHVSLEPRRPAPGEPHRFLVQLRTWPAPGAAAGGVRVLGEAGGHGPPVRWVGATGSAAAQT